MPIVNVIKLNGNVPFNIFMFQQTAGAKDLRGPTFSFGVRYMCVGAQESTHRKELSRLS